MGCISPAETTFWFTEVQGTLLDVMVEQDATPYNDYYIPRDALNSYMEDQIWWSVWYLRTGSCSSDRVLCRSCKCYCRNVGRRCCWSVSSYGSWRRCCVVLNMSCAHCTAHSWFSRHGGGRCCSARGIWRYSRVVCGGMNGHCCRWSCGHEQEKTDENNLTGISKWIYRLYPSISSFSNEEICKPGPDLVHWKCIGLLSFNNWPFAKSLMDRWSDQS